MIPLILSWSSSQKFSKLLIYENLNHSVTHHLKIAITCSIDCSYLVIQISAAVPILRHLWEKLLWTNKKTNDNKKNHHSRVKGMSHPYHFFKTISNSSHVEYYFSCKDASYNVQLILTNLRNWSRGWWIWNSDQQLAAVQEKKLLLFINVRDRTDEQNLPLTIRRHPWISLDCWVQFS